MEHAGSETNRRAAFSLLALNEIKEKKTATGQRTIAGRHIFFFHFRYQCCPPKSDIRFRAATYIGFLRSLSEHRGPVWGGAREKSPGVV